MATLTNKSITSAIRNGKGRPPGPTAAPDPTVALRRSLRTQALQPGGITEIPRAKAWPLLLDIETSELPLILDARTAQMNKYADIVAKDVARSLWSFVPDEADRDAARVNLEHLINAILASHPAQVAYYQGYHDIASVVLLNCDQNVRLAFVVLEKLSLFHLRDYVTSSIDPSIAHLSLIFPLLRLIHERRGESTERRVGLDTAALKSIYQLERKTNLLLKLLDTAHINPHFALSWVITWFTHTQDDFRIATRLVDFFLVSHPLMPVYVSAAVLIHAISDGLLDLPWDVSMVHPFLSKYLERPVLQLEKLLQMGARYFELVPPEDLPLDGTPLYALLSPQICYKPALYTYSVRTLKKAQSIGDRSPVRQYPYEYLTRLGLESPKSKRRRGRSSAFGGLVTSALQTALTLLLELLLMIFILYIVSGDTPEQFLRHFVRLGALEAPLF